MVLAAFKLKTERTNLENFQLKTVAKYLGIEVDESRLHDAQYDIYLTYELYKLM
jgi:DNA polymerase-3 subunit epsilon